MSKNQPKMRVMHSSEGTLFRLELSLDDEWMTEQEFRKLTEDMERMLVKSKETEQDAMNYSSEYFSSLKKNIE